MEGEAPTEEGGEEGAGPVSSGMQGAGQRLSETPRGASQLQRKQPLTAGGEADSRHSRHHHLRPVAAPADLLRLPQAVHGRLALPLPQLDVHRSERVLPDLGFRSGASTPCALRVAARLRAVLHVLHDQRRIQLRSAHVPHERARNGAARHADHLASVQRRVRFLLSLDRVD